MKRILVGLSGGVDSTYGVSLLQQAGYTVEGAVLRMHSYTDTAAALESAGALGIPCRIIDCEEAFAASVVQNFIAEYRQGRTPNPCIICNPTVKFRLLYETAMAEGFDGIATGHYAAVRRIEDRFCIARAADASKDQSYMLYRLTQPILEKLILPLAQMAKTQVVAAASGLHLLAADRAESQEICFIRNEKYTDFLTRVAGAEKEGWFVDAEGHRLGRHHGISHYTVGQRKGLGISGESRLFVKRIDPESGDILLSAAKEDPTERFWLQNVVWQGETEPDDGLYDVMLRYRAPLCKAHVRKEGQGLCVTLEQPAKAVTPGQSAVLYRNDCVQFGGVIRLENKA